METLSFWNVLSVPGAVLRAGVREWPCLMELMFCVGVDSLGATSALGEWLGGGRSRGRIHSILTLGFGPEGGTESAGLGQAQEFSVSECPVSVVQNHLWTAEWFWL